MTSIEWIGWIIFVFNKTKTNSEYSIFGLTSSLNWILLFLYIYLWMAACFKNSIQLTQNVFTKWPKLFPYTWSGCYQSGNITNRIIVIRSNWTASKVEKQNSSIFVFEIRSMRAVLLIKYTRSHSHPLHHACTLPHSYKFGGVSE